MLLFEWVINVWFKPLRIAKDSTLMWKVIETNRKGKWCPDQTAPTPSSGEVRNCVTCRPLPPQTPSGGQSKNCLRNPNIHIRCPAYISLRVWPIKLINHLPLHIKRTSFNQITNHLNFLVRLPKKHLQQLHFVSSLFCSLLSSRMFTT